MISSFQTIVDAVSLFKKWYYIAKLDLYYAYKSILLPPSNYKALRLKGNSEGTLTSLTLWTLNFSFEGYSAPGIFHHTTQVQWMMAWKGYTLLVFYLDEFLVIKETGEACLKAYSALDKLLVDLGFQLSHTNTIWLYHQHRI